jgi:hypothetical protein
MLISKLLAATMIAGPASLARDDRQDAKVTRREKPVPDDTGPRPRAAAYRRRPAGSRQPLRIA